MAAASAPAICPMASRPIRSHPPYVIVNAGVSREIKWSADSKPMTLRFDIVNLLDKVYELRDGSGIGVFAPQFGARRGFYVGVSQKL